MRGSCENIGVEHTACATVVTQNPLLVIRAHAVNGGGAGAPTVGQMIVQVNAR
jgi:hypothetical protein